MNGTRSDGVSERAIMLLIVMLFLGNALNYVDRQVLALLKPTLEAEFGWSDDDYAHLGSAFQLAAAAALLRCGGRPPHPAARPDALGAARGRGRPSPPPSHPPAAPPAHLAADGAAQPPRDGGLVAHVQVGGARQHQRLKDLQRLGGGRR